MKKEKDVKSFHLAVDKKYDVRIRSFFEKTDDFLKKNKHVLLPLLIGFLAFPTLLFAGTSLKYASTWFTSGMFLKNIPQQNTSLTVTNPDNKNISNSSFSYSLNNSTNLNNTNTTNNNATISNNANNSNNSNSATNTNNGSTNSGSVGCTMVNGQCSSGCVYDGWLNTCIPASTSSGSSGNCPSGQIYCASTKNCMLSRDYNDGMCPKSNAATGGSGDIDTSSGLEESPKQGAASGDTITDADLPYEGKDYGDSFNSTPGSDDPAGENNSNEGLAP